MRLHHLRLQAFGPFAGTEEIDFDELAAGGLHLIHGPTGAGKTSILDAICFALFAGVPGGRSQGRETLRSDHAAPSTRPEVELEFGVGERRLRVRRIPEHQVPKKRGTGTRAQRGSVTLEEWRTGSWEAISTRSDEVAQTIGDLLGMGLSQFAQVMLLPQGEFTAFLRAKPDDRGRLLERLFDIGDFAAIEQWLAGHRKELETRAVHASTARATLIARAQETLSGLRHDSGVEDDEPPAGLDDPNVSVRVLDEIVQDLSDRLTTSLAESDAAAGRVEQLRARLADERSLAALQHQARGAQQALDRVAEQAPQLAAARERLSLAERSQRCVPVINAVSRRRSTHLTAVRAAATQREQLARFVSWSVPEPRDDAGLTDAALRPLTERVTAGTVALSGLSELQRQRQALETASQAASSQLKSAERRARDKQSAIAAAEAQRAQLAESHATLLPEAVAHPQWVRFLADVERVAHALDTAVASVDSATAARHHHRQSQQSWAEAEREVIRLRNARLAGIAAELADQLVDGDPCPVCGSTDHPHAAQPAPDHVDAERLSAAEDAAAAALTVANHAAARWSAAVGRAQTTCVAVFEAIAQLESSAAGAADGEAAHEADVDTDVADGSGPLVEVTGARADLLAELDDARTRSAELATGLTAEPPVLDEALQGALDELSSVVSVACGTVRRRAAETESAVQQLRVRETQLTAFDSEVRAAQQAADTASEAVRLGLVRVESLQDQVAAARDRIDEVLRHHEESCGCTTEEDPVAAHARSVELLDRLTAAAAQQRTAFTEFSTARDELAALLDDTGFADAESAIQATLSEPEIVRLRSMVSTAETDAAKATGVLEQPEVAEAIDAAPARVEAVAGELQVAERAARHTHDAVGEIRRALDSLQRIATELGAHDERNAALADQLAVATSVASAVAGSGDNTMRMRLTAYVLAARLESVTALANQRLHLMTDGRYQLEHTDERAARGSKSGLGLRVRDAWTGTTRDTATLSGGESFIASLALALGLGDAVLEAAGGRRLETLLVDEGFGSLDEDSLEQVLDVLDGLRAGGRNVGIVSHVPELRARIPAQIRVRKTARGSTVEVVTADVA
ncbi:MAG TPA: SMC family ATPase [Flexivirga sp.]|uniref:SMC family ATPase n=1 Tax=Flexivirga sp. TaxID=1962927 RepID=UPI002B75E244|nr:SMC family ATPase [Flexivirga sp.]HWC22535.1 SMC family ATPase [Flexivirga sp.]